MDALTLTWQESARQLLGSDDPTRSYRQRYGNPLKRYCRQTRRQNIRTVLPQRLKPLNAFRRPLAQVEQRLARAREQVAQLEAKLQTASEGLQAAELEVEESSKDYWKYALGIPKNGEEAAEGQANGGDALLVQTILADMGSKLRPEQQQQLKDMAMADQLREQNHRKMDDAMLVEPSQAKTEVDQLSG